MSKAALVTGSSRGLGRSIVTALAESGWKVAVHCKDNIDMAADIAAELKGAVSVSADVRDREGADLAVRKVQEACGRIDLLVNNAGITKEALLLKTSEKDFDEVIGTNLKGPFNFIRAVSRQMMKQRDGKIINISSYAGVKGREGLAAYSASKAALIGLTMTAARELSRYCIMVNAVLPGYMMTEMGQGSSEKGKEAALRGSITGRFSDPDRVAEFIVRLAGIDGVTGQVFNLDSRIL